MAFPQNSKPSTVFLGDQALGDLFADQSQFAGNLDDQTTYLTSADNRFAISYPRELSVVADLATGDSGVLVYYGTPDASAYTWMIHVDAGGVHFYHNSGMTPLASITLPNLGMSERRYVVSWNTCPDHVGGDDCLSEFAVCDLTSGTWVLARATHDVPASDPDDMFSVGATGDGSLPLTGGVDDIQAVRVGRRFMSTTEIKEDWQSLTTAPTPGGKYLRPEVPPFLDDPYTTALFSDMGEAIANDYAFAGPCYWVAATMGDRNRIRLYSPIVNQVTSNPVELTRSMSPSERFTFGPDGDQYILSIYHLWKRPLPKGAAFGKVRCFLSTYLLGGSPMGSTVDISMRVYSMSRLPHEAGVQWSKSSTVTSAANYGSAIGAWFDFGDVVLRRIGNEDMTYLMFGFKVNALTGADFNALKIRSIRIDPLANE